MHIFTCEKARAVSECHIISCKTLLRRLRRRHGEDSPGAHAEENHVAVAALDLSDEAVQWQFEYVEVSDDRERRKRARRSVFDLVPHVDTHGMHCYVEDQVDDRHGQHIFLFLIVRGDELCLV